jgi:hypothetical protein
MKKENTRKGLHLYRIQPILFGGNPVDPENTKFVTRLQHAEFVVFWNRKVNEVKD